MSPYANPTWIKFQCEHGCQWTAVKGGIADTTEEHRTTPICNFSGCTPDHNYHLVGETADRHEAAAWFKNIHEQDTEKDLTSLPT